MAHTFLGQAYVEKRMYDEAIAEFQKSITLSGQNPDLLANLGFVYAAAGRHSEALQSLDELFKLSKHEYVAPYMVARIYVALGKSDQALEMLEKAHKVRDSHILDLSYDPTLDPLRSNPRFAGLVQSVGLTR
ncbi:MAG: hypothetical protein DMF60_06420 [Acidobacteria bacterium]|nr:MAG: hypothetical protein DMF60_06420 [Acidobacteriota bacterium]